MKKNPDMAARVAKYQNKRGIEYATADGTLYKFLKILYILLFAVNLVFNLFYILVKLVSIDAGNFGGSDIAGMVEIGCFSALLIAGFVLTIIRRTRWIGRFVSMAALCAAAVTLGFITVGSGSAAEFDTKSFLGIPLYFYLRHGIPALAGIAVLVIMTLIDVFAGVRYNRLYRRLEEELYAQYLAQTAAPTDEGWQAFLAGTPEIETIEVTENIGVTV